MTSNWCNKKVSGVLLDISGVLINHSKPIDGSVLAYQRLKNSDIPVRLVTNESACSVSSLVKKLHEAGFRDIKKEQIFSPAPATCQYLQKHNLRPHLLVNTDVLPDFDGYDTSNPNCVVIGDADQHFTYDTLNIAFNQLIKMNPPILLSMGKGRYYKGENELMLDVGAFKVALEYAADTEAIVLGKPSKDFFMSAVEDLGLTADQVVMVGDDLKNDIGGAQSCGIRGLLVRTGKFRPCDENDPTVKPDEIVDDLAEAVNKILKI